MMWRNHPDFGPISAVFSLEVGIDFAKTFCGADS